MAVTLVIAGLMITMTNGVLRAWNRTSGSLSSNSQARQVFSLLRDDLQSAFFRNDDDESLWNSLDPVPPDPPIWLAIDVMDPEASGEYSEANLRQNRAWVTPPDNSRRHSEFMKPDGTGANGERTLNLSEDNIADCRFGMGGMWLRFFTQHSNGTVTAVSYQIVRRHMTGQQDDPNNTAEVRYMLTREETGAHAILENGYDLPRYGNLVPNNSGVIADNVIDFGVRLYERDDTGNYVLLFPADSDGEPDDEYFYEATGDTSIALFPPERFPDVIDVTMRILTEEGARQIQLLEGGRVPVPGGVTEEDAWWDIAEAHSRVYTQRIFVNASPF